ncbi:MAG: hypothetical protein U0263_41470 [Polyangiaceae bacterium]
MTRPTSGHRALALDFASVLLVSLLILLAASRLWVMAIGVPSILGLRFLARARLPDSERDLSVRAELPFFLALVLIGGGNDWNSVHRHHVYDYTVPAEVPELSSIPIWMLLYWGLILRFILTLSHSRLLALPPLADSLVLFGRRVGGPVARALVILGLTVATRQSIYRAFEHPIGSWLPFAVALGLALVVLRPDRRRILLVVATVVVGPLVEAVYIGGAGLHRYRLGWFFGVPLWIALWWGLAVLGWDELGTRFMLFVERSVRPRASARSVGAPPARPAS